MSSSASLNRLAKAKNLLASFQTEEISSQNYTQIHIILKGLKFIEDPQTGDKNTWFQMKYLELTQKFMSFQDNSNKQTSVSLVVRNSVTMIQIYTFIRNKLKQKFKDNRFENQALQLYVNGKLIAGNQNLAKVKDIIKKYETNTFTCERTEVFG